MPLTAKGRKIKSAMQRQYGKERGERIFGDDLAHTETCAREMAKLRAQIKDTHVRLAEYQFQLDHQN